MNHLDVRGVRALRASPVVVAVLVAGLVTTQSSATADAEASAASASASASSIIDVSPPDRAIPIVASVATASEQSADSSVTSTGTKLAEISKVTRYGLPTTAKAAYQRAARRIEQTRPGCDLPWGLLAGIGRVESDHGRYGGSQLGVDGVSRPPIRGIALNGVGPVAAIPDTDNGRLDRDKVWDRAVGPMQFIPSTWATAGADGDRDGVSDPNDLDDAALAAAGYLCPASGPIGVEAGIRSAIFSYNHSDYYVDLVYAFALGYHTGVFNIPSPPVEPKVEDLLAVAEPGGEKGAVVSASARPPEPPKPSKPTKTPEPSQQPPASEPATPPKPPKSPASPEPTPEPTQPALVLKSGTAPWSACGGGWCASGYPLDLGPTAQLAAPAAFDFDGDGLLETNSLEFDGLVGRSVTFQVERGTAVVYTIQGSGYRNADGSFARPVGG